MQFKSPLLLKDRDADKSDLMNWKWAKGAATLKEDFGAPLTSTNYVLCVYDRSGGTPTLKLAAEIPAGGTCDSGRPCWKETARGFKYTNKAATPDGIVSLTLKEGFEGSAQITLKSKGVNVPMPTLPLAQDLAVTVQLKKDGGLGFICWDADYAAPALRNEEGEFRDK